MTARSCGGREAILRGFHHLRVRGPIRWCDGSRSSRAAMDHWAQMRWSEGWRLGSLSLMLINYLDAGRGPASKLIYSPAWRWSILVADATHYG
jgi:hypothetical protein